MPSLVHQLEMAGRDRSLCAALLARLSESLSGRELRFMEVCGTHTVAIFQSGLRSLLPATVKHLSGPGCPVCVTHESEVALFLELAQKKDVILATFGDLLRVPGPGGFSLRHAAANGAEVRVVYSPLACLGLAKANPSREIVFIGVGFETTAPTVAASLIAAREQNVQNFSVLCLHKLIGPALRNLLQEENCAIDAFLLPGHVATITGLAPFEFLAREFNKPAVVSGFEPADILLALCALAEQGSTAKVQNAYPRAVAPAGNPAARAIMERVFLPVNALWRGLGNIDNSGLGIRPEFADYDANAKFGLALRENAPLPGCLCGEVLKGRATPAQCRLFGKKCTPASPLGPCMVSTEGSCAAWFKYGDTCLE